MTVISEFLFLRYKNLFFDHGVASENGKIRTLALGIFGAFCIGSYLISISECTLFTMS